MASIKRCTRDVSSSSGDQPPCAGSDQHDWAKHREGRGTFPAHQSRREQPAAVPGPHMLAGDPAAPGQAGEAGGGCIPSPRSSQPGLRVYLMFTHG